MSGLVKICGLSTPETLEAALSAGADMVGFVHFAPSPRHLSIEDGRALSARVRSRASRVLLMVDPDDETLSVAVAAFEPESIQLHGSETPDRVAAVRRRFGRPVMKAIGVAGLADLKRAALYRDAADMVLIDAKPPPGATRPGGNGAAFDWRLLAGFRAGAALGREPDPGMSLILSGGLHAGNVAEAVAASGLRAVDVSSGVETRPGEKDPDKIKAFVAAARAAFAALQDRRVA